jgi:hypothetical protein
MSYDISQAIEYYASIGVFRWRVSPSIRVSAGSLAGSVGGDGYWQIQYRGRKYIGHRLAWFLMTGVWPAGQIDHRNGDKLDNRWCNLRLASSSQNCANTRSRGFLPKGVTLHRQTGKYQAQIKKGGKNFYLGLFESPIEANAAYAQKARELFGDFARSA